MTASSIRILLAVLALDDVYQRVASKDVAHLLGVRKPTIHNALAALQDKGIIAKERYGDVYLTAQGRELARRLEKQRDDLAIMFARDMCLDNEEAVTAAILLMSGLREDSLERMCACCEGKRAKSRAPAVMRHV